MLTARQQAAVQQAHVLKDCCKKSIAALSLPSHMVQDAVTQATLHAPTTDHGINMRM
jgi:hypothetical protein